MKAQTKSSLKLFLVIIGLSFYGFLTLCYIYSDNDIIEYLFLSSSLGLTLCLVVSYFSSTMYYDNDTTNTPYDYTEHIEYECTGSHIHETIEQFILINLNTQQNEDLSPY